MAFPTNLTNAVDGITDVMADHLNYLEAKVGIDGSLVTTSLDYLLKNPGSVDPGHLHTSSSVGAVPTSRTVNGHVLTGDVTISKGDVDLGNVPNVDATNPANIIQDATHRLTTDTEKSTWNSKQDAGNYITALTGDVTASGPGCAGATIQAGAVNLSKMANLAANSIIGNNSASPATPLALSASAVKSLLAIAQADVANLVSDLAAKLPITTYQDPTSISPGHKHVNLHKPDGSAAVTVDSTGKVGIGTTSPGAVLDVRSSFTGYLSQIYSGNTLRTFTYSTGISKWYLNNGTSEVGVIEYGTPGGNPGITIQTGATYNQNRFDITNYGLYFSFGFNADGSNTLNVRSGGNVGIGVTSPHTSALLHLSSTTKGFLPPVMTTTQKAAISSPPAGLVVFDATLAKLCVYSGAAWETITSA